MPGHLCTALGFPHFQLYYVTGVTLSTNVRCLGTWREVDGTATLAWSCSGWNPWFHGLVFYRQAVNDIIDRGCRYKSMWIGHMFIKTVFNLWLTMLFLPDKVYYLFCRMLQSLLVLLRIVQLHISSVLKIYSSFCLLFIVETQDFASLRWGKLLFHCKNRKMTGFSIVFDWFGVFK